MSGTATAITSELDALVFTPTAGAPNTSSTTTFTLSDQSSAGGAPVVNSATSLIDSDPAGPPADSHQQHPVAERQHRPGLDLGDGRQHSGRRRPGDPQSRAKLDRDRRRRFQQGRPVRHPVAEREHRPGLDLGHERERLDRGRPRQPPVRGWAGMRSGAAISTATVFPTSCGRTRAPARPRSGK